MTKLYTVIHLPFAPWEEAVDFAIYQTKVAVENGADGVFVIDMHGNIQGQKLVAIATMVKMFNPEIFVGVNDLTTSVENMIHLVAGTGIDALWTDRVGNSESIEQARLASVCFIPIFRGVIFKYQSDFHTPMSMISSYLLRVNLGEDDVLTTSGPGTGHAADIRKIKAIHEANNGAHPIAIASGVSAENVALYTPYVDYILAASSIINGNDEFIPDKVAELAQAIKN